ncbi:hypothetical protein [Colwellia sp. MB02u-14]|uniref:hypothetical protein n=1 Tax=Colwellia sp. MB02u-14 TaxID=2759815 RepID=UPI0015F43598|nr:hypothetical protein [Colwellia sp. MB02u-14]MBA6303471.1 hypothetical protein [Colwellia sp. MB02u-14]
MTNSEYFNVELISTTSPAYKRNNRKYKRISDKVRQYKSVDHYASSYNKALLKWEFVVQSILSSISNENRNRILKFTDKTSNVRFREIDFIAEPTANALIFCELKLKEKFNAEIGKKASGWAQLNKSISIAEENFNTLSGLSICVDMSLIYGLETEANEDDYCQIGDLEKSLTSPLLEKRTLWLSSIEISSLAIKMGLLTQSDVAEMKKLHKEYKNPLSVLNDETDHISNNPFQNLSSLFDNSANKNSLETLH